MPESGRTLNSELVLVGSHTNQGCSLGFLDGSSLLPGFAADLRVVLGRTWALEPNGLGLVTGGHLPWTVLGFSSLPCSLSASRRSQHLSRVAVVGTQEINVQNTFSMSRTPNKQSIGVNHYCYYHRSCLYWIHTIQENCRLLSLDSNGQLDHGYNCTNPASNRLFRSVLSVTS